MQFNVAGLLKSSTGDLRVVDVEGVVDIDDPMARVIAPIRGRARLIREPAGVLVEADLTTRLELTCARCLAPVEEEISVEVTESFQPTVYIPGGPPVATDDSDPATLIDELHVLDLTEVARQAITLAVPLAVLCREGCRGLCARCGADLNEGPCGCRPDPDPRWDALRPRSEDGN